MDSERAAPEMPLPSLHQGNLLGEGVNATQRRLSMNPARLVANGFRASNIFSERSPSAARLLRASLDVEPFRMTNALLVLFGPILEPFLLVFAPVRTWERAYRAQRGVLFLSVLLLLPLLVLSSLGET